MRVVPGAAAAVTTYRISEMGRSVVVGFEKDRDIARGRGDEAHRPQARAVFEHYNIVSGTDLRDAVRRLDLAVGKVSGKVAPIRAANAIRELRE